MLVETGTLYKRRGIGMFVATGAREALLARRRAAFAESYIRPLLAEAARLGLTTEDVTALIHTHAPTEGELA
jgi:DNA-binding transcriptional regulator YhcF (GntR family)